MRACAAFASTGGFKLERAIRSFRRTEPDLPVLVAVDASSRTWQNMVAAGIGITQELSPGWKPPAFQANEEGHLKKFDCRYRNIVNTAYINGMMNAAMRMAQDDGFDLVALFHDDVVFPVVSSSLIAINDLTLWLRWAEKHAGEFSGLTLSLIQAFVPGTWARPPAEWDALDLEGEGFWRELMAHLPAEGMAIAGSKELEAASRHDFPAMGFFVYYYRPTAVCPWPRLGPTGQIVPVEAWRRAGGFDETDGIFYDIGYAAECRRRGLPPVLAVPSVPHLHLHNQSIGFADPARGIWGDTIGAFQRRYGVSWEQFREEVGSCASS